VSTFGGSYRTRDFPDSIAELEILRAHPFYTLREYVYYQAHRTAASAKSVEDAIDADIKRWVRKDPRFQQRHPEALEHLDAVTIKPKSTMGHILYTAAPFKFAVLDMTVKLLMLDKPGFILSDNPVVLRNQYAELKPDGPGALGTLARGLQMFMPASPTMAIAIYDGDIYECGAGDEAIVKVSTRNAHVINAMQVRNANDCLYLHPDVLVDHHELRRAWLNRPDTRPRTVEGPMRPRGDGTFSQYVYSLPPEIEPLPRLRCFQIRDRTMEVVRSSFGDMSSFPIRSLSLAEASESMAAAMDWKVKNGSTLTEDSRKRLGSRRPR
jgi:hypothetical protein